jgi:predicted DCC family thiol-disulfide oxidoreductase YuxK
MQELFIHLVFFDGTCGLCDQLVQSLVKADKDQLFAFAPLQGSTAQEYLKSVPASLKDADSVILIENFRSDLRRLSMRSQAAFRICWLLGGAWKLIGWLFVLPSFLFDWIYRLVAGNRHRLFPKEACFIPQPNQRERFLP